VLFSVSARLRVVMELGIADRLPHYRRVRDWRGVGACAYVHRRVVACAVARTPGWLLPGQYCSGHSAGLLVELPDCANESGSDGMALDVGRCGCARAVLSFDVVFHSAQPPVVGPEE